MRDQRRDAPGAVLNEGVGLGADGVDFAAVRAAAARVAGGSTTEAALEAAEAEVLTALDDAALEAASRRHRVAPLGRASLPVRDDPERAPDCERCQENCCRGSNLARLTLRDVARLSDAGLGWAIARIGGPDDRGPGVALKHRDGRCVFLDAEERCAVHPIRPLVCRGFPWQVSDDWSVLRYSRECQTHGRRPADADAMAQAAVDTFNERIRDLLMIANGIDRLRALGLDRDVPALRAAPRRAFADVLRGVDSD